MPTLRLALIGQDIERSVSPELHRMLFPILNGKAKSGWTDIEYEKVQCSDEEQAAEVVRALQFAGYTGANVTMPFKSGLAIECDELLGSAKELKSVNTLTFCSDGCVGTSTDGAGLLSALDTKLPEFSIGNAEIIIRGAGDTARAVLMALLLRGLPEMITIYNRSPERGELLRQFLLEKFPAVSVEVENGTYGSYKTYRPYETVEFDRQLIAINATPVGKGAPDVDALPMIEWKSGDIAIDVIYNPILSGCLKRAQLHGAQIVDGLSMLIQQAAIAQWGWLAGAFEGSSRLTQDEFLTIYQTLAHSS